MIINETEFILKDGTMLNEYAMVRELKRSE